MKKTGYFAMLIRNHFTNVVSGQKNNFLGNFHMRNISAKHRTTEKYNFEEYLKGAKKCFQETKMRWHMRKNEHFPVKCCRTPET